MSVTDPFQTIPAVPVKPDVEGMTEREAARAMGRYRRAKRVRAEAVKANETAGAQLHVEHGAGKLSAPVLASAEPPPEEDQAPELPSLEEQAASLQRRGSRARRGHRDITDSTGTYKMVPIDDLHPDPDNPRKTLRNLHELAASIKLDGMLEPVIAREEDGKLIIMYGHRRHAAARIINLTHVPTIIRQGIVPSSVLAKQLAENSHRDDLDPIEEARGIRRYMRENKMPNMQRTADSLGHSLNWVANRMALLDLGSDDQDAVSRKEFSIVKAAKKARTLKGTSRKTKLKTELPEPPHFSDHHSLASRARAICRRGDGKHVPKLGGVACGACWEEVIRADALG